jgi:uncharacterized protein
MTVDGMVLPQGGGPVAPSEQALAALHPLDHSAVRLSAAGRLGQWQRRTLDATIPHVLDRVESGEARSNLARLVEASDRPFVGMVFTDSDVYKTLEAVAWAAASFEPGDERMKRAEQLLSLAASAQEPDGYLNSWVQGTPDVARWSTPQWGHELYTAGHLFQAAVAAQRAGVLPGLLDVAERFADLLVRSFGSGQSPYIDGHPQVETALVELYRATGVEAYLALAGRQIDARGHHWLGEDKFGSSYFQDAVPLRDATQATGHAVRQLYLLTGAVDVAVETRDDELLAATVRLWDELSATKSYVTGAYGSRHRDEALGDPYELPADRAYAETCAAIAAFQLAWRLLLATGESRFADAMETGLYNSIAASTSVSGTEFFYSNPLHLRTGHDGAHEDAPTQRLPWFSCACCPPNLARFLASVNDYLVTRTSAGIQVHQPTACEVDLAFAAGRVKLTLVTDFPYDEVVRIDVESDVDDVWELALRIPAWCKNFTVNVDGAVLTIEAADGYARVRRSWSGRHAVSLTLELPVRRIKAHPRVDALRGCLAIARGPLIYALEEADLPPGIVLEDVRLLDVIGARRPTDEAVAPVLIDVVASTERLDGTGLYSDVSATQKTATLHTTLERTGLGLSEPFEVALIPYHRWANRTPGAMRVWLPTASAFHSTH